jgi:hypothetical protein
LLLCYYAAWILLKYSLNVRFCWTIIILFDYNGLYVLFDDNSLDYWYICTFAQTTKTK